MTISREYKLKQVIDYVKNEIENGNYPSHKDLKQKFTTISYYKIHLDDIYSSLGINMLKIPIHKSKYCRTILEKGFIDYLKIEVSKGHYPTRIYLERKFKTSIKPIFKSICDLYFQAGIVYKQENSQELKNKKAKLLTKIALSILPQLGLDVLETRRVYERGVDIVTTDYQGKIIGIEIKAHNKYEPIKKRNYLQLERFLKQEKLSKVILITTSSRFHNSENILSGIDIIDYEKLRKLCTDEQIKQLNFIRDISIHQETDERNIKREMIINYAKKLAKENEDIAHRKISNDLHLGVFSYFDSIGEVYDKAGILPPIRKIGGRRASKLGANYETMVNKILDYMKEEISKGHYPSGIEVGQKFGVKHIWNFITMTELYNRLGINPYKSKNHRFKDTSLVK